MKRYEIQTIKAFAFFLNKGEYPHEGTEIYRQ